MIQVFYGKKNKTCNVVLKYPSNIYYLNTASLTKKDQNPTSQTPHQIPQRRALKHLKHTKYLSKALVYTKLFNHCYLFILLFILKKIIICISTYGIIIHNM